MGVYLDDGTGGLVQQTANQATFVATVITTAATSTTPYGFATAAQANNLVTLANAMQAALIAAGIMKAS